MNTIFITIYDGDTEKNILRSGVLEKLRTLDHRIILFIRGGEAGSRLAYYKKYFESDSVVVEPLPLAYTTFERWAYHLSWNSLPTRSAYVKRHDLYLAHRKRLRYVLESLAGLLGHIRVWRELLRFSYYILPDDYAAALFEKHKPNLVFAPNMFSAEDCRILRAARKRSIPTLTMAKSWDVPTTRGFTRVKADAILVFNEINKREIVEIGDYAPEKVHVVGFPQFDAYTHKEIYISRSAFCEQMGLDNNKKIILFAVPGDFKNPYSDEIMQALDKAVEDGKFVVPVQFIARFHPKYPSAGERLKGLKHFILNRPGTYFSKNLEQAIDAPSTTTFEWTYTDADIAHLANSIYHSAMVINTESTMTLDAAAINRPVVLIGFDGNHKLDYWHSIIRNYSREHLQGVLETNGARLAKSVDELMEHINTYLADPVADATGRELLRRELIYRSDGKSAERIVEQIAAMTSTKNHG